MSELDKLDTKKKKFLEALEKCLGVVTQACKLSKMPRSTHYHWLKTDELYKEAVESISEMAIDFAESSLYEQIKEGNTPATIFYLKTKGKNRGYIERKEHEFTMKGENLPEWLNES